MMRLIKREGRLNAKKGRNNGKERSEERKVKQIAGEKEGSRGIIKKEVKGVVKGEQVGMWVQREIKKSERI